VVPLLITRAADEAAVLVARLPDAIAAPCLAFEALNTPRPELPEADLLVTSPRVLPALASIGVPHGWRVLALAPATAATALALGLRVDRALAGGAAALAAAARPDHPVVTATSDLGGDEVQRVRPDAVRWVLYRTVCPPDLPAAARAALEGSFDVLFTSPSAVRHFDRLAPGALARARRILCHGGTTLAEVTRFGRVGERFALE
jgi:uroporphyrinogen-III synthase